MQLRGGARTCGARCLAGGGAATLKPGAGDAQRREAGLEQVELQGSGWLRQKGVSLPLVGCGSCRLMASRKASSLASFFWFRASYSSLRASGA